MKIRFWPHVLGGDDVHAGAGGVREQHLPDGDRRGDLDGFQRADHIKDLALGHVAGRLAGDGGQGAAGHPHRAGHDAGGVGHFLAGVGVAPGAGVAGDGGDRAVFQLDRQGAAHRAADADQIPRFHPLRLLQSHGDASRRREFAAAARPSAGRFPSRRGPAPGGGGVKMQVSPR